MAVTKQVDMIVTKWVEMIVTKWVEMIQLGQEILPNGKLPNCNILGKKLPNYVILLPYWKWIMVIYYQDTCTSTCRFYMN